MTERSPSGGDLRHRWPDVRFGFAIPQVFTETEVEMSAVETVAIRADQAGLDSLWTQSQLFGAANVLEALTLLSFASAITRNVRLGCATLNTTEHDAAQLAKQLSSLDNISGGRAIAVLGMGPRRPGVRPGNPLEDRPVRQLLETLRLMKELWADGPVDFHGEMWHLDGEEMNPKPVQRPRPPIWLGGTVSAALERAVKHGEGWIGAGACSTEQFKAHVSELRTMLAENGRDPVDFTIAKRVYVAAEASREAAVRRLQARFASYSDDADASVNFCIHGSPAQVAEGIEEILESGAQLVVLNPVYDFVRQQELLLEIIGA